MIETIALFIAWATFGYALAIIHLGRETTYLHTLAPDRRNVAMQCLSSTDQTVSSAFTASGFDATNGF